MSVDVDLATSSALPMRVGVQMGVGVMAHGHVLGGFGLSAWHLIPSWRRESLALKRPDGGIRSGRTLEAHGRSRAPR
jgi:hypothetical protein